MNKGILSTIGHTPLVKLERVFEGAEFNLYAKLEAFNPGGSIKDRTAFSIIQRAMDQGQIGPRTTVIESSSGNMGIGLAQACAYYGIPFICVVDPKTTKLNIEILKAFGAEVDIVTVPDKATGEYLPARIARVEELLLTIENSYWPDQYSNLYNARAHYQTMREIVEELDGKVDYLFCATSTCGTMRGCAEYVQDHKLPTRIFAVDALGSAIFGNKGCKRLIPGHGAAVRPQLFLPWLADECIHVSDSQCVIGCRRLAKKEALLCGGSSGAVLSAIGMVRHRFPRNSNCVAIFPDRGERYLDTIYSTSWVQDNLGDLGEWEDEEELVAAGSAEVRAGAQS
ncbi:MAG TPA: 2,3-diaminopropionate biosynthesis protein SbnA [Pyrinomonadaceae bacterium]|nr:2,3-diaminopropionate biosynthesis protein SbnA [Pyrinomonadaceae bacterium]